MTSGPPVAAQPPTWARAVARVIDGFTGLPAAARYAVIWVAVVATVAPISYYIMGVEPKPGAVDCDGKQMSQGDICEEYVNGRLVDTKSYDEVWQGIRDSNMWIGRIGLAIAAILLVVGTVHVIQTIRESRATASR